MGLLDSVLGAMNGGGQTQAGSGAGLGGLDNIGDLINLVSSNPQLLQAIMSLLSNDGANGGLNGLVARFQQAGLGDVVGSWIGSGHNQNISGDQLSSVLGEDTLGALARKLGVSPATAAGQLSNILPGLIDYLTPQGQTPAGGLGDTSDLLGLFGGLMQKR